jgi:hypothetical protein
MMENSCLRVTNRDMGVPQSINYPEILQTFSIAHMQAVEFCERSTTLTLLAINTRYHVNYLGPHYAYNCHRLRYRTIKSHASLDGPSVHDTRKQTNLNSP